MTENKYIPGMCNIGPEEIRMRRNIGWIALAISILLFIVLAKTAVSPLWRVFIFFPAMMSASGFLQAHFQFCTGFAHRGVFNFGAFGQKETINDDASKANDKKKGNQIMYYAVLIGIVVAIVSVLV